MKLGLMAASAAAALVLGSQTASAQPLIVQPAYAPGITIGGAFYGRGVTIGGAFAPAPAVVAAPGLYAAPVVVAPPPVVIAPRYGYAYPPRPYYAPYGHYNHYRRW
ncbi:MAG TPA: hypothetical protein VGL71_08760 [Urbifossiella sp.]